MTGSSVVSQFQVSVSQTRLSQLLLRVGGVVGGGLVARGLELLPPLQPAVPSSAVRIAKMKLRLNADIVSAP